jgi:hypothetical protein
MSRLRSIHWLAPTTMVSTLVGSCLLALGHHLFYNRLNGEPVPTRSYHFARTSISRQQYNTAIGTALAFLVRTLLAVAVATAYTQIFWRNAKSSKRSPTLRELDWASGTLDNVFNLLNFKTGLKYPTLIVLALLFW